MSPPSPSFSLYRHEVRAPWALKAGTTFHFVSEGIEDERLFDGIDPNAVGLEIIEVLASSKVTHLRYAVKKKR